MKPILSALLLSCICAGHSADAAEPDLNELLAAPETAASARAASASGLCSAYNSLNRLIRDGRISKAAARAELPLKLAGIRAEYYGRGGRDFSSAQWIFPVAGYDASAIDRGGNHGFVPSGYDFFSGNRHGGHPAYDIFIRDRNQDSRDDKSGAAVAVVSMTGGIVVALEKEWEQGSELRGGKYIWVYDPGNDLLVYYAHNEEVLVDAGTVLRPGDLLATVGRSGFNAAKRRSPTHLHFSVLRLVNGRPVPLRAYRTLRQLATLPAQQSHGAATKKPPDVSGGQAGSTQPAENSSSLRRSDPVKYQNPSAPG